MKYISQDARFSPDGQYRFELVRRWGEGATLPIIMLNPSKAGAECDDPTIRKCVGQAQRWGYKAIVVRNLFSFIATDQNDLWDTHEAGIDIVEADANRRFTELFSDYETVWIAWGAPRNPVAIERANQVMNLAETCSTRLICMGCTAGGYPRHPSRARYLSTPVLMPVREFVRWRGSPTA